MSKSERSRARGRRGGPERGASSVEYAAALLLIAAIVTGLVGSRLPTLIRDSTVTAVCRVFSAGCGPSAPAAGQSPAGQSPAGRAPGGQGAGGQGAAPANGSPARPGGPGGGPGAGTGGGVGGGSAGPGGPGQEQGGGLGAMARGFGVAAADTASGLGRFLGGVLDFGWGALKQHVSTQYNMGKAAVDDVIGLYDLVTDPGQAIEGLAYAVRHPGEALRAMVWDAESQQMYERGDFGGAVGRVLWNAGSWFLPGYNYGKAVSLPAKLAKAAKAARAARAAKAASTPPKPARRGRGALACPTANSFVPGTLVLLADGSHRPIEDVNVGDLVWATDPVTGKAGRMPVSALIAGAGRKHLVDITVDPDGRQGGPTATITATGGHPFWDARTRTWANAEDLSRGDALTTPSGGRATVVKVRAHNRAQRVHNLTVAGLHTYFVRAGASDLLVHNCGELDVDERAGGHTISDHVLLNDAALVRKAESEPNGRASRWVDQQQAQQAVTYLLSDKAKQSRIGKWRTEAGRGGSPQLVLTGTFGRRGTSLGVVAHHDGRITKAGNRYVVVLRRAPGHPNGYIVYTAYPDA